MKEGLSFGFYFDQTRCISCFTCAVACKDWHDVPAGPASWIRLKIREEGKYPDLQVSFLFQSCYHCSQPGCVEVCPVQAITKREDNGIVVVDRDVCLGKDRCGICSQACPYDAPQFGAEEDAKMQKCDLCQERWAKGQKPVCVAACPLRALDAGPIAELESKYGPVREAEGFTFSRRFQPNILFKPRQRKTA
jgi:anaerobic dimethyl sulfoxide reductase subunit B (iron-sulfur subunit)